MFKRFLISGTKKNDVLTGTDGLDVLLGKKGNDFLYGGDGNDFLFGDKGNDQVFGEDGNDKLFGGKGNDFLDGGAGSDYVFGGKGDDTFNFTLSENSGAKDYYDGGKGMDTLQLTLSGAQYDAAKAEIDKFQAFLADGGKIFHFESFGLTVRNFEDVKIELVGGGNTPPVANPDSATVDEDHGVSIDVLANDTDADAGAALAVTAAVVTEGLGTVAIVDNQVVYNPGDYYQHLAVNESAKVAIGYTISDGQGGSASSFVDVIVTGVNDAPVAVDDDVSTTAIDGRIRVAVLGVENQSTHIAAAGQLDATIFKADPINYTDAKDWATILNGYEVVVLGDSGLNLDYGAGTSLFAALGSFVTGGGGVVTTGNFAHALAIMPDSIKAAADAITPITPAGSTYAQGAYSIQVAPIDEAGTQIAGGIASYTVQGGPHEVANGIDGTATLATFGSLTAIAYDDVSAGRTVYLGALFTAPAGFPFFSELTRSGDVDHIFEQAVAWAAGARGVPSVTVSIDVLANDTDVDATDVLAVDRDTFPMTSLNGAALSFDENGNIVYTPTAARLQELLDNQGNLDYLGFSDSFNYMITDSNGGSDMATVNLTVSGIELL